MQIDMLPSSFHDGTCGGIEFDMEAHRLLMEISDENQCGFFRLHFEECQGVSFVYRRMHFDESQRVSFVYQDDSEDLDTSLTWIMHVLEKTEPGAKIRHFEINFDDDYDTLLEIRCSKFYMESIDGFTTRTYLSRLD